MLCIAAKSEVIGLTPPHFPPLLGAQIGALAVTFFETGLLLVFFGRLVWQSKKIAKQVPQVSQKGDFLEGVDMPEV